MSENEVVESFRLIRLGMKAVIFVAKMSGGEKIGYIERREAEGKKNNCASTSLLLASQPNCGKGKDKTCNAN